MSFWDDISNSWNSGEIAKILPTAIGLVGAIQTGQAQGEAAGRATSTFNQQQKAFDEYMKRVSAKDPAMYWAGQQYANRAATPAFFEETWGRNRPSLPPPPITNPNAPPSPQPAIGAPPVGYSGPGMASPLPPLQQYRMFMPNQVYGGQGVYGP